VPNVLYLGPLELRICADLLQLYLLAYLKACYQVWVPSQLLRSLQGDQGDVVFLLPALAREARELGEKGADQGRAARTVGSHQALKPGDSEHLGSCASTRPSL
jgi:hypothetical protein